VTQFKDLGLAQPILQAVAAEGYDTPTPIQAKAIPPVMEGADLIGIAQTGTGKTAAFALPILHRLAADRRPAPRRSCRVLVLSPTRELASQIAESFRTYGAKIGVTVAVIYGGVKYGAQIRAMAPGVDVLVACPGRLLDHVQEKTVDLSSVETFVLDEADQMLDLGFLPPIKRIVRQLSAKRQTLMFSATMPKEIRALASEIVHDPVEVSVTPPAATAERVEQQVLFIETARKRALLAELFADNALSRTLVFSRTKHGADKLANHLEACGVDAAAIHGNKSQGQRERALAAFKAGDLRALVATDIAARGIDVDGVTHVINFDLPNVPESYVHRIGRTARAGAGGKAISLVADDERNLLRDIQKLTRQTIPAFDRRNDRHLGQAQAADAAADRIAKPWTPAEERTGQGQRKPQGGRGPKAQASDRNGHPKLDHSHAPSRPKAPANRNRRRRFGGGQARAGAAG
jgi:ATP-dependent RNA helicase RhlE